MADAAAVILAGGRGERLGGTVKANIEFGGVRLIDRVFRAVGGAAPVYLARGAFGDDELPVPEGMIGIADAAEFEGPLGGVAAALRELAATPGAPSFLLSVAVDTPFFPAAFLDAARARIGCASAVVARFGQQEYPTNVLWRVADVVAHLGGAKSLKRLLTTINSASLEWPGDGGINPFDNINTHSELVLLEQRAKADFGVGKVGQTR